jgi:predicted ArsR family transcriptional regulator
MTPARDRILRTLKTRGPATTASLARRLGVTTVGARQHLDAMKDAGLLVSEDRRARVGRPARWWSLSDAAHARFPDSHGELAAALVEAARAAFGPEGAERMLDERMKRQAAAYRKKIPGGATLERKVAALASIRTAEGYMAEWSRDRGGSFVLVENHCPIRGAAGSCPALCGRELELFRVLLRPARVERTEHILAGARRCAYAIAPDA